MKIIKCPCGMGVKIKNKSQEGRKKYCSKICFYKYRPRLKGLTYVLKVENKSWFQKGKKPWNFQKMIGLGNYSKGYDAIHGWVERWLGRPGRCENCSSKKNLQWSNISGEYKRKFNDWQRLCAKCHQCFDFEKFGLRAKFFAK